VTRTRVELARSSDARGTLIVDLEVEADGTIRLGWFDFGPSAEESRGGDVERDLRIAPAALRALRFALLQERFTGDFNALAKLRALCKDADIPVSESGWN
jgi:hypothetical protein